jgi:uncharacterized membrane protein YhiD involved in acid resistance
MQLATLANIFSLIITVGVIIGAGMLGLCVVKSLVGLIFFIVLKQNILEHLREQYLIQMMKEKGNNGDNQG